jgi:hypothetical protein
MLLAHHGYEYADCADAACISPSSAAAIRKSQNIGRRIETSRAAPNPTVILSNCTPRRHGPWALRLLAGSPHGCTEAIMLARGFTTELLETSCATGSRRPRRGP